MIEIYFEDFVDCICLCIVFNLFFWMILGFFVLFVIWVSVVKLDCMIYVVGWVVLSSWLQVVINLEGGIVVVIFVYIGDIVWQG